MTYAEKLKDPRWQKCRLAVLERDNFTCNLCGDTKTTLHIHHKKYLGNNPWETPLDHLETLCEVCHWLIGQKGVTKRDSILRIYKDDEIRVLGFIIIWLFTYHELIFQIDISEDDGIFKIDRSQATSVPVLEKMLSIYNSYKK